MSCAKFEVTIFLRLLTAMRHTSSSFVASLLNIGVKLDQQNFRFYVGLASDALRNFPSEILYKTENPNCCSTQNTSGSPHTQIVGLFLICAMNGFSEQIYQSTCLIRSKTN